MVCDCTGSDLAEAPDGRSLIFFNAPDRGFWEVALPFGSPHKIPHLEEANARKFWSVGSEVYSFSTKKVSHVMDLDRMLPVSTPSLAVSPDGRSLIYFELWCLAASAINGCGACVDAHEHVLREKGASEETILAAIRIASTIHALSAVMDAEAAAPSAAAPTTP